MPQRVPGYDSIEEAFAAHGKALQSEREMQSQLFEWAAYAKAEHAELELLHAIPNGQYRRGQRAEPGLKSGVPDVCLPAPRGGYHGLYLELKTAKGRVSRSQRQWLAALEAQGYLAAVVRSFDEARAVITDYLTTED